MYAQIIFFCRAEDRSPVKQPIFVRSGRGDFDQSDSECQVISYDAEEMIINVIENGDSFNEVPVFDQLENPINSGAVIDWE